MATLQNTREQRIAAIALANRTLAGFLGLTGTSSSFIRQKNVVTSSPASITVTASVNSIYSSPAYLWERSTDLAPNTWTTTGLGTTNTQQVTNTNFETWVGSGGQLRLRCTVTQAYRATVSSVFSIDWVKEGNDGTNGINGTNGTNGTDGITVVVSTPSVNVPSSDAGVVSSYISTGTNIRVLEGSTPLTFVNSGAAAGQFSIGAATQSPGSSITVGASSGATTTTATIAPHSSMAQTTDSVVITYPITIVRSGGGTVTTNATQVIAKAKAGLKGDNGTAGSAGSTAVFAYKIISSVSLPAAPAMHPGLTPTAGTAIVAASASTAVGWYSTPAGSLSASEWMFQIGGVVSPAGVYTWNPQSYLSTFRVGQLSALGVTTGNLTVDNTLTLGNSGKIQTNNNTGFGTLGVFLGDDGGTYKFSVGTPGSILSWNGSTLTVPAGNLSGTIPTTVIPTIGGGNLIPNSSFEVGSTSGFADNWGFYAGGNNATVVSDSRYGTIAQSFTSTSSNAVSRVTLINNRPKLITGEKYVLSAWIKVSGTAYLNFKTFTAATGGTESNQGITPALTTGGGVWKRLVLSFTAPNSDYIAPMIGADTPPNGTPITVDAVQLEQGEVATEWGPRAEESLNSNISLTENVGVITLSGGGTGSVTAITTNNKITPVNVATYIGDTAISTNQIAANAITAGKIAAGSISASAIASDAVISSKIAAGSITTSKLLITGNGDALNADPMAEDIDAWTALSSTDMPITLTGITDLPVGSTAIANPLGLTSYSATKDYIPVDQNKKYKLTIWAKRIGTGVGGTAYLGVVWYDAAKAQLDSNIAQPTGAGNPSGWNNGTFSYYGLGGVTAPAAWTSYTIGFGIGETAAIPTNAKFFRIFALLNYNGTANNQIAVTNVRVQEKADSDLIVDGAITALKLSANSVTAVKISAGSVLASAISAGAVTANALAVGSVSASAVAANAITAAKIAAGAITASKLTVADTSNMIPSADLADPSSWSLTSNISIVTTSDSNVVTLGAVRALLITAASVPSQFSTALPVSNEAATNTFFGVEPSGYYRISGKCLVKNTFNGQAYVILRFYNSDRTTYTDRATSIFDGTTTPKSGDSTYDIAFTGQAPSTAVFLQIFYLTQWTSLWASRSNTGSVYFANPRVHRAIAGELVVDGAITANKLTVTSLSAISGNMGALTVDNTLSIGTTGKIQNTGGGYTSSGIFLGYHSGGYRFSVGDGTNNLIYDGTNLTVPAGRLSGTIPGTVTSPSGWVNSNITVDASGILQGIGTASKQVDNSFTTLGQNLLPNSDFNKVMNWIVGWNPNSATFTDNTPNYASHYFDWDTSNYVLSSGPLRNGVIRQSTPVTGTTGGSGNGAIGCDLYPGTLGNEFGVPVITGQKYCFSVYIVAHRCNVNVGITYLDANGAQIGGANAESTIVTPNSGGASKLSDYSRLFVMLTAPAGAVTAFPFIRKRNTFSGEADSYMWFVAPQLEAVNTNATGPSPYQSGPIGKTEQILNTGLTLVGDSNVRVDGDSVQRITGNSSWDAGAYSKESYVGGAFASVVVNQTQSRHQCMFGLSSGTNQGSNFNEIDHAIYFDYSGPVVRVYEDGTLRGTYPAYSPGDIYTITYDGSTVRYIKNGTVFYQRGRVTNDRLFFDSSIYTRGGTISGIKFGPLTKSAPSKNLIDSRTWVYDTTGAQPGFLENGYSTGGSNYIAYDTLPDGSYGDIWRARSGNGNGSNNPEGGFQYVNFPVDPTKTYRITTWIRPFFQSPATGPSGYFYLGFGYNSDFSDTSAVVKYIDTKVGNTNPYGIYGLRNNLQDSTWHLLVCYILPYNYTGAATVRSGVYNGITGKKVTGATIYADDYQWTSSTTFSASIRAYQYYTDAANNYQDFWNPRVEIVDGTEPSIDELISTGSITGKNPLSATNITSYIPSAVIGDAQIGNLNAGKINAGFLSATRINAGTISVDKLTVTGRGRCINDDPTFDDNSAWTSDAGSFVLVSESTTPVGSRVLRATNGTRIYARSTPLEAGKQYKVSMWHRQVSGGGSIYLRLYCYNYASGLVNYIVTALNPATGNFEGVAPTAEWTKYTGYITAGSAVVRGILIIHTNWNTTGVSEIADARVEEYVGGDLIVDGAIVAAKLATNSVETDKLAANSIIATKIAAGAITADRLAIINTSNLIDNPNFEGGQLAWTNSTRIVNDPTNAYQGNWVMTYVSGVATNSLISLSSKVFCEPGESYRFTGYLKAAAGSTGNFFWQVRWYNAGGSVISATNLTASAATTTTWTLVSGTFTAPANCVWVQFAPYTAGIGTFYWDQATVTRAANSDLIVDGAITASKMTVAEMSKVVSGGVTSGGRVDITASNGGRIAIYDTSNNLRVKIGYLL